MGTWDNVKKMSTTDDVDYIRINFNITPTYNAALAVIKNIHTPLDVLEKLKNSSDYQTRRLLVLRDTVAFSLEHFSGGSLPAPLPSEWLEELAEDDNIDIVACVAGNIHTPARILERLSTHPASKVRANVVLNPSSSFNILYKIASSEMHETKGSNDYKVLKAFLEAEHITSNKKYSKIFNTALRNLAEIKPEIVAENPKTPSHILEELHKTGNDIVKSLVATNRNVPYAVVAAELETLLNQSPSKIPYDTIFGMFIGGKTWKETLKIAEIVKKHYIPISLNIVSEDGRIYKERATFDNFILPHLLISEAAPEEFIREKYYNTDFSIYDPTRQKHPLTIISRHENTPSDVLQNIAETPPHEIPNNNMGLIEQEGIIMGNIIRHRNINYDTLVSENMLKKISSPSLAFLLLEHMVANENFSYETIKTIIYNHKNMHLLRAIKIFRRNNKIDLEEAEKSYLALTVE